MKLNEKLEFFLISMLTNLLIFSVFVLLMPNPQKIATVDLHQLIQPIIEAELKNSQPMKMKKQAMKKKMKQLHEQLKLIAEKEYLVLVPKEAVLAGAIDKTDFIQSLINHIK